MFLIFLFLVNKRLDEWVPEDYLDTRKVQFPRRDGTQTGQNTGATTPKKNNIPAPPNLPGSVERDRDREREREKERERERELQREREREKERERERERERGLQSVSRPASPVSGSELVNGSAVLAAALQKKLNRKRKVSFFLLILSIK